MSKEILSKEIYLNGDYSIGRLLEIMKEKGLTEARNETCKTCKWWNEGRKTKNIIAECDFGNTITGGKFEKTKKAFYVDADADDSSNLHYELMTGEDFGCVHHTALSEIKKSDKMEKGGTALSEEEKKDIAWDIGLAHQFIEDGKWKNDDMKTKAYKMAELEMIKYRKGGKAKAVSTGGGGIDWLITGGK